MLFLKYFLWQRLHFKVFALISKISFDSTFGNPVTSFIIDLLLCVVISNQPAFLLFEHNKYPSRFLPYFLCLKQSFPQILAKILTHLIQGSSPESSLCISCRWTLHLYFPYAHLPYFFNLLLFISFVALMADIRNYLHLDIFIFLFLPPYKIWEFMRTQNFLTGPHLYPPCLK